MTASFDGAIASAPIACVSWSLVVDDQRPHTGLNNQIPPSAAPGMNRPACGAAAWP